METLQVDTYHKCHEIISSENHLSCVRMQKESYDYPKMPSQRSVFEYQSLQVKEYLCYSTCRMGLLSV